MSTEKDKKEGEKTRIQWRLGQLPIVVYLKGNLALEYSYFILQFDIIDIFVCRSIH